jgi:LPXTG-motif cell wall-anchored protein
MGTMPRRAVIAAAAVALGVGGLAGGTSAQEPPGFEVDVYIEVLAPDASGVMDDLTVEIWPETGTSPVDTCLPDTPFGNSLRAFSSGVGCEVPELGMYQIGLAGAPTGATVTAACSTFQTLPGERIPGGDSSFTVDELTVAAWCDIVVVRPAVLIDKVVADGDAVPGDFTLEVYGTSGEPITATDTSPTICGPESELTDCAVVPLPAGDYQLGEVPTAGYLPSSVWCTGFMPENPDKDVFPDGVGAFSLGDSAESEAYPFVQCLVTNAPFEGTLIVEKVVVNDDGGTATAADFTAEVYLDGEALDLDGTCAANGDCLSVTVPVGEYRIGETGPTGYTPSVACSVTGEPDHTIVTTPPNGPIGREAIAGDAALVEVVPNGEVTCVITNDDIATTPTTTTPTTTTPAPTTTDVGGQPVTPTTLAPALPATGPADGTNSMLIVVALGLLTIGGSLMALRRR